MSARLWFDRLAALLPLDEAATGVAFVSDSGEVFSESAPGADDEYFIPTAKIEEMVKALRKSGTAKAAFTWRHLVVEMVRVSDIATLEGGSIYVMAHADSAWVGGDSEQSKATFAMAGLTVALLILAGMSAFWVFEQRKIGQELMAAREMAEGASKAKSGFLAHMSHEIRTPITAVLGYLELIGEPEPGPGENRPTRARMIEIARRNALHMLEIIDDILDLSRIEANRVTLHKHWVNPREIARECVMALTPAGKAKGIQVSLDERIPDPGTINSDPTRLWQIIMNLLGNAVKFTERGTVVVSVRQAGEGSIEIRVADTGPGMTAEQQGRLFRSFSQVDSSVTRKHGGTGLGLVITKHYAEMLGGTVQLGSAEGRGTTAIVKLPVNVNSAPFAAVSAPSQPIAAPQRPQIGKLTLAGKRMLVVEDHEDNQALIRYYLESAGASVEVAVAVVRRGSRSYRPARSHLMSS